MSSNATLSQGKHLAELFENLESGQLQALIASGLLTDLRRCAKELDPTKVNREKFRLILGFGPSIFTVKMGGPKNTDQINTEIAIPFNTWITQENFPLKASGASWHDEIEIIDPGCSFSEEEGLKFLADAELDRPTYEHAIRFVEQHGKKTTSEKKPSVIFLHEPWLSSFRGWKVISLTRRPQSRALDLHYTGYGFDDNCVLAGVRPRK